jgi:SAM-dependent methyltransferase
MDNRNEEYWLPPSATWKKGKMLKVRPDVVADFTAMPFPDEAFHHVVFDPPHIIRKAELGRITVAYGCLKGDWESMLAAGFSECFRVLKPNGTLIFKWCEAQIPLERILALTPEKPLYGHRTGAKARTHWCAFLKPSVPGRGSKPEERS